MIPLFTFSLAVFGVAFVVGHSKISLPFRMWLAPSPPSRLFHLRVWLIALLECPACTSWHLGWIAYVLHIAPIGLTWWIAPFYCCATSLILAHVTGLDDEQ